MANSEHETASTSVDSVIVETSVGAETVFKGSISTGKPIRIDGYYEGSIDSDNIVIISKTGRFNGDMKCRELQLAGRGEGSVVCTQLLEFTADGEFKGDISTANIVVCEGSVIDGNLKMTGMR